MILSFLSPAIASIFPFLGSNAYIVLFVLFIIAKNMLGYGLFTGGLPSLAAFLVMYSYRNINRSKILDGLISFALPLLFIELFTISESGRYVPEYSFYWFIPPILYTKRLLTERYTLIDASITASFVSHSVGTIVWMNIFDVPPTYWTYLIPIVFVERLLISMAIYVAVMLTRYAVVIIKKAKDKLPYKGGY